MAEETKKLIPVKIIEDNVKLTIEFDNNLHKRIQNVIFYALPFKDLEHLLNVSKQVQNGDFKSDPLADHLFTLLYIISKFEEAAEQSDKVITKQFDTVSKKIVED